MLPHQAPSPACQAPSAELLCLWQQICSAGRGAREEGLRHLLFYRFDGILLASVVLLPLMFWNLKYVWFMK